MGNFKSFYKNERGDALTPTLILSAVALTVMLGLGYSLISLVKMQRGAVLAGDRVDVREQIKSALSFRKTCLAALSGQSIPPGLNNSTAVTLNMYVSGQNRTLAPGAEAATGLTVASLTFKQTAAPVASSKIDPMGNGPTAVVSGRILKGNLSLSLRKTNTSLFARDYKPDDVPVTVAVDSGNKVIACITDNHDGDACSAMGNAWLPLNPPGSQCLRQKQCDLGGGYCNAPTGKGGFKNPATNSMSCPDGYKARQKGVVTFADECGKSCVKNETFPVIECAKCRGLGGDSVADDTIPANGSQTFGAETGSAADNQLTALESFFAGLGINL